MLHSVGLLQCHPELFPQQLFDLGLRRQEEEESQGGRLTLFVLVDAQDTSVYRQPLQRERNYASKGINSFLVWGFFKRKLSQFLEVHNSDPTDILMNGGRSYFLSSSLSLSEVSGITGIWYLFLQLAFSNHQVSEPVLGTRSIYRMETKEWFCVDPSLNVNSLRLFVPRQKSSGPGTGVLCFYPLTVCSHQALWRQMVEASFQQNPQDQGVTLLSSTKSF